MVGGHIIWKIAAERSVQRQTFLIRQLQHRVGKDRFAQRRRVKDGVFINRGRVLALLASRNRDNARAGYPG
jgi:hypothetical protein